MAKGEIVRSTGDLADFRRQAGRGGAVDIQS
jgi:hypothetical protein